MSQLMAFIASHFRRLVTVWTLFGPMSTCLQIRHLLVPCPSRTRGLPYGFPGRWPASGHALSLSFSPTPGPWSPSPVLCYKRYWGLSGPSHLKRKQGPTAVAVVTLF